MSDNKVQSEDSSVGCSFIPTRKNQPKCKNPTVVNFGEKQYCKDHKRTVQAKKEQEKWSQLEEERLKKDMEEKDSDSEGDISEKVKEIQLSEEISPSKINYQKEIPIDSNTSKYVKKKKIYKNKYGRFEDPDTHFVFHPTSRLVYGLQDHVSGLVRPLSEEDKRKCVKRKWKYLEVATNDREEESESESEDTSDDSDTS